MIRINLILILCLLGGYAHAQLHAITETGEEVLLHEDGSWNYLHEKDSLAAPEEIMLNEKEFIKDKNATFLVKSKNINLGVWIDPKEWDFSKADQHDSAELQFKKKEEDLYALFISEKIAIPVETLKVIAVDNAKSVAPDLKVEKEEYRMVNGIKVLMMQMTGTIQGIHFSYYGYYYSNENGTVQLLLYTAQNLVEQYLEDMELFLNGFVEL